jgi:hypothetical protein
VKLAPFGVTTLNFAICFVFSRFDVSVLIYQGSRIAPFFRPQAIPRP